MKTKLHDFLCRIGLHDWKLKTEYPEMNLVNEACARCPETRLREKIFRIFTTT